MKAAFDDKRFYKDMTKFIEYTEGFLQGVQNAKPQILDKLGKDVIQRMKEFIDANARVNPQALHHIYEWSMTGTPQGRLFDLGYQVRGAGISFNYTFRQSVSIADGSTVPFYDKARIMELGVPVTIRPRKKVLAFQDDGEQVFTSKPVVVTNPGGEETTGALEQTLETFFNSYFTQAYLNSSQIFDYLKNPFPYKDNLQRGMRGGRGYGRSVGYGWASGGAAA